MDRRSGAALIFEAGAGVYAIPIEHVAETLRPLTIEPLAGTPDFVLGVSILRGVPVPVVDVSRLVTGIDQSVGQRLVTIKLGARRAALLVSSVIGVRRLSSDTLAGLPALLRAAADRAVAAISFLDADLLVVLNATRIVPDEVWSALEPKAGP